MTAPRAPMRSAWLLVAARTVRSVWQGALVVDFALYLRALGWSAVAISTVLALALLLGAALTIVLGPLSDRHGRRGFLLTYDAVQGVAALVAAFTASPVPLAIAAVVGGFGRGGAGAAGPFAPIEQAWLAQCVPASERGPFYSLNAALGFLGMAVGAVLAGVPGWLAGTTPGAAAYRPLFVGTAVLSAVSFLLLAAAHDSREGTTKDPHAAEPVARDDEPERRRENALMLRLVLANLMNGAGLGLSGPLMTYWFAVRFQHGPASIGPTFAIGFVLAAASSLFARWLSRRLGVVGAVVLMRSAGLLLLLALPFAGSFAVASVLYVGRTVLNRGTSGARSALNIGLVRPSRRGFSAASANVALQIPRSIGPIVAGACYEAGLFSAPFVAAAVFQAGYIWLYGRSFRNVKLQ